MSERVIVTLIYLLPLLLILTFYIYKRKKHHKASTKHLAQAKQDGLTDPTSLHPVIDPLKCLGCGSCISACHEQNVLGLIDRQAHLITPSNCIGHGACKIACPQDAITLVFGSESRGVDIPELSPDFQSNVPGIFIAGELGGMGLIKNAIEQGSQAINSITRYLNTKKSTKNEILDCIIVGSGPAGISATLGAKERKLNIVTIDQDVAGGTVSHFPRGKLVMTAPANMPIVGKVKFGEISKEKLLKFWLELIEKHQLQINQNEAMLEITKHEQGHFILKSSKQSYETNSILLAIGRRGTPRKLNVKGEELSKVVYRLIDATQYINEDVLVVGGGDSALEAACSIAKLGKCRVSMSYRSDTFSRAKAKNREIVDALVKSGDLSLYMSSQVNEISEDNVMLNYKNETVIINNSIVIVCAGGVLPTPFLKKVGIMVVTKYGTE